jgi:L-asparaginase type I
LGDEVLVAAAPAPQAPAGERPKKMKDTPMKQALSPSANGHPDEHDCSVGLVLTGGTIGAQEDNSVLSVRGGTGDREAGLLERVWPGHGTPHVLVASPLRTLSENLQPHDWVLIARAVRELVEADDVAGVLIFHGTDTMAYTAAALSFLLSDLPRPVVLTGANLPSGEAGSDAERNVRDALVALQALERGTYVAFTGGPDLEGRVYLGTRVRKLKASGEAFSSVNRKLVGVVEGDRFLEREEYVAQDHKQSVQDVDEHVLALRLYPGLDLDAMFEAVIAGAMRGVVIELYAAATGPDTGDRFSVPRFVRRCVEKGVVVATAVPAAPTSNGKVYATHLAIREAGGLFLRDMLPETATVKLMWALAQSDNPATVRELMLTPIAGELKAAGSPEH